MTNPFTYSIDVTLSDSLWDRLARHSNFTTKIHSVFRHGLNIKDDDRLIYLGATPQSVAAHGMVWDAQVVDRLVKTLKPGHLVQYRQGRWRFYGQPHIVTVHVIDYHPVNCSIRGIQLTVGQLTQLRMALRQLHWQVDSDLLAYSEQHPITTQLRDLRPLVGYGHGLTPSGDDYIQGILLIDALVPRSQQWVQQIDTLLRDRLTTDVATAYYHSLADQEVNQMWIQLIQASQQDNPQQLLSALSTIQSYGASSGNDMLWGVYRYLTNYLQGGHTCQNVS